MPCKCASFLTRSAALRYTPPTFSGSSGTGPSSRCSRPWPRSTTTPRRVNARNRAPRHRRGEYRLREAAVPRGQDRGEPMSLTERGRAALATADLDPVGNTFPKLLLQNVERFGDKVAIREK